MLGEVKNNEEILSKIKKLTVINQLVSTHYVEKNQGTLSIISNKKIGDEIVEFQENIDYKLKSHRIINKIKEDGTSFIISDLTFGKTIISDEKICECLSKNINKIFIKEFSNFSDLVTYNYKFYTRNIFQRIFNPINKSDLINFILGKIEGFSWIIVNEKILKILEKSSNFNKCEELNRAYIKKVGKISNIDVFINNEEDENTILMGNYDSVVLVIDNDIKDCEKNTLSNIKKKTIIYTINYSFLKTGKIAKIKIF